tara:strand:+ start:486 stop:689 length:204 start_codon:yes stop_codon:yes gene_type:complete
LSKRKIEEEEIMAKRGLYANIHAKRKRIKRQKASGAKKVERMRSKKSKYAPTLKQFKAAAKTAKKRR